MPSRSPQAAPNPYLTEGLGEFVVSVAFGDQEPRELWLVTGASTAEESEQGLWSLWMTPPT